MRSVLKNQRITGEEQRLSEDVALIGTLLTKSNLSDTIWIG